MTRRLAIVAHQAKLTTADRRALRRALDDHEVGDTPWFEISHASEARRAARAAMKSGADVVVACGGDGTVRSASSALLGSTASLAVLPVGTANLFATGHALPDRADDVIAAALTGEITALDSGRCNGRSFNVMAGCGFDADLIGAADRGKRRWGMLAYVRGGLVATTRPTFDATVEVDGRTMFDGPVSCVLVANLGSLRGGVQAFPDARPDDGLLDLAVVTAAGPREWAGLAVRTIRGTQRGSPHVHLCQGKRMEVVLAHPQPIEMDGGRRKRVRRLEIEVEPGALRIVRGATGSSADTSER